MNKVKYFNWYKGIYYHDVDRILLEAKLSLEKYKGSKNPKHPKCVERIERYKYIIQMLEPQGQQRLF